MYPVCFDCFDKILVNIGERTKETEQRSKMYAEQLVNLEVELASNQNSVEENEIESLEAELAKLYEEFKALEHQEKEQDDRFEQVKLI